VALQIDHVIEVLQDIDLHEEVVVRDLVLLATAEEVLLLLIYETIVEDFHPQVRKGILVTTTITIILTTTPAIIIMKHIFKLLQDQTIDQFLILQSNQKIFTEQKINNKNHISKNNAKI